MASALARVFTTFTGPVPPMARIWAAKVHAGSGAVLGGETALWLAGAVDRPPAVVQVCVPHGRWVVTVPGVVVVARRHLPVQTHPAGRPERLRVEVALLMQVNTMHCAEQVVGLVLQVMQRRTTTCDRVRAAAAGLGRLRWRALVLDLMEEVTDGVQSRLEYRFRRDVERAHGLPSGRRNEAESVGARSPYPGAGGGRVCYRDVRYRRYRLVVELDGALAHPAESAWRDRWRDNETMIDGDRTLRYGWREVAGTPCQVAVQLVAGLHAGGWSGTARPCGPGCPVAGG